MSTSNITIKVSDIVEGDRARNTVKYGNLEGIKASIKSIGLIQPITLARDGDKYHLVAGGRRFRAISELGIQELHHGITLDPNRIGFLFKDEVPEDVRLEAELDENLHRLDMDWIDNVLLIYRVHRSKKNKDSKWGQRQTAALLNNPGGVAKVNYALRAAKALLAEDKEIMSCKSLDEANQVFTKRKEDEALAELQRRTAAKLGTTIPAPAPVATPLSEGPTPVASGKALDALSGFPSLEQLLGNEAAPQPTVSKPVISTAKIVVPLSRMFFHRDSIRDNTPWPVVDHIVTDIPYAIDMGNLENVEDVEAEHDVEENLQLMPIFLTKAFNAVKPGGFCVFFYDLDHHEKLQAWALEAGWRVQRWPFIAAKTSACRNNAAQYNTTKNYEVAMFLRKDEKTVLRKQQPTSWKAYDFAAERKLYNNPFAKPFELWKDIYDMISFPGQTVLDPYCGEMSACRAAANCGLIPMGIELKEQHYNRGLHHMRAVYAVIHQSNCEFA